VIQAYLPYDYPDAVARFLAHFQPRLGVLMETELWPNLLAACAARRLPVVLANARLSARSAAGYARFAALARPAFAALGACAAQTPADAARLRQLGTADVTVCGNLKFDVTPAAEKRALGREWKAALAGRPVWLAASTREGEELPLLEAWQAALQRMLQPDPQSPLPLLVLVPRHPQRFDEVAALVRRQGLWLGRRSAGLPDARCQVWLGDSMGEMPAYYTLADLAFIGGSLLPLGGQNLIEAAACACPVLIGPHTFNFTQATEDALAAGAARRVQTATELVAEVEALLGAAASRQQMVAAAEEFASAHRGATERTLALIARCYPAAR
jgi:3-deoxy-D-manno-octulosonic-acid transferase